MRVIAGELKGRALKAPRGLNTRPSSARVREALFSVLGPVNDMHVLDLYAGSGALGVEALSRGAHSALFVERANAATSALRANLSQFELNRRAKVIAAAVEKVVSAIAKTDTFDLILVDPPYKDLERAAQLLTRLSKYEGVFAEDARLVIEHASRDPAPLFDPEVGWSVARSKRYGDTMLSFYDRQPAAPAD